MKLMKLNATPPGADEHLHESMQPYEIQLPPGRIVKHSGPKQRQRRHMSTIVYLASRSTSIFPANGGSTNLSVVMFISVYQNSDETTQAQQVQ